MTGKISGSGDVRSLPLGYSGDRLCHVFPPCYSVVKPLHGRGCGCGVRVCHDWHDWVGRPIWVVWIVGIVGSSNWPRVTLHLHPSFAATTMADGNFFRRHNALAFTYRTFLSVHSPPLLLCRLPTVERCVPRPCRRFRFRLCLRRTHDGPVSLHDLPRLRTAAFDNMNWHFTSCGPMPPPSTMARAAP